MSLQKFFNTKLTRIFQRHSQNVPKRLAIALSGGVDSMALTHLAYEYSRKHDVTLHPITINHNLRPTSAMEISIIKRHLEKLDLLRNFRTMDIHLETPSLTDSAIMAKEIEEEARVKRYAAITEVCSTLGVKHILLGHHLDDQIETYCIRLLKNSGIFGLAGMQEWAKAPVNIKPERLQLVRPLLDVKKEKLYEHCLANDIEWVQDYTNFDEEYGLRNVVRKYLHDHKPVEDRMLSGYTAATKFNHRVDLKVRRLYGDVNENIEQKPGSLAVKLPKSVLNKHSDFVIAKFLFKLLYPLSPSKNYHYSFNKILDIIPRLGEPYSTFSLLQLQWSTRSTPEETIIEIVRQTPPEPVEYTFILMPNTSTEDFLFDNMYWLKVHNPTDEVKHYTIKTLSPGDKELMEAPPKDYKYTNYKNTPVLLDHSTNTIVAFPVHDKEDFIECRLKENIYTF